MDLALSYNRSRREAEEAAAAVRSAGRRVFLIQADLSRGDECRRLVDEAAASLGRLDVLINMASIYRSVPFDDTDEAVWDAAIDVDLKAAFLCARAAATHLRAAGGGRIINFSDWVAASGRPRYKGYVPYYVAKRGVIGLDRSARAGACRRRDSRQRDRARPHSRSAGHERRGTGGRGSRDAARPLGRRGGDRQGGGVPARIGLRHRRDDPRRRRASSAVEPLRSSRRRIACLRCSQLPDACYRIVSVALPAKTAAIDSSAPVSSWRSRAKQKRM